MATRDRLPLSTAQHSSFDGESSPRSDQFSRHNRNTSDDRRQESDHDERATLEVVDEFTRVVQNKIDQNLQINQPNLELEVANIRRKKNPKQYSIDQWKRSLSDDLQNCPDCILRVSMAYGDNPHQVKSVLQEKINAINTNGNPNNTGLNNLVAPLQSLRRDLENRPPPNIPRTVRDVDEEHLDRAVRLFLSEASHFARGLEDYRYDDAETAVKAIREVGYESNMADDLLPLLKSFREANDIREYLQSSSKRLPERNEFPATTVHNDRRSVVKPVDNRSNSNSPNLNFPYKPLVNPYAQSDKQDRAPQRSVNRSREDSTDSRDSKRNN